MPSDQAVPQGLSDSDIERKFHRWWKDGERHPGCSENWGAKTAYEAGFKAGAAFAQECAPAAEDYGPSIADAARFIRIQVKP